MLPKIFGFIDSYTLMFVLGIVVCFAVAILYLYKKKLSKRDYLDLLICGLGAILFGVIFALLFQNLYDFIADYKHYKFAFRMTFFGGLFGGVIGYLFIYYVFIRKNSTLDIINPLKIAPACICLAHGFGRIGCFLAPCCYGIESENFGLYFPSINMKVIPTQLYEAIFLFLLAGIFLYLAFKKDYPYTFVIYLIAYSIFRFIIEFFRGDDRGGLANFLSPSQVWCIILLLASIPLYFVVKKYAANTQISK